MLSNNIHNRHVSSKKEDDGSPSGTRTVTRKLGPASKERPDSMVARRQWRWRRNEMMSRASMSSHGGICHIYSRNTIKHQNSTAGTPPPREATCSEMHQQPEPKRRWQPGHNRMPSWEASSGCFSRICHNKKPFFTYTAGHNRYVIWLLLEFESVSLPDTYCYNPLLCLLFWLFIYGGWRDNEIQIYISWFRCCIVSQIPLLLNFAIQIKEK